jgi:hypothetical protein
MFLRTRPASSGRGEYWGGPGGHQRLIPVRDEKKTPAHKALWLLRAPAVHGRDASARLARRGLKSKDLLTLRVRGQTLGSYAASPLAGWCDALPLAPELSVSMRMTFVLLCGCACCASPLASAARTW